jgi:transcriptional regulator with GAF, ATPase, and Fis domain
VDVRATVLSMARADNVADVSSAFAAGVAVPTVVLSRVWVCTADTVLVLVGSAGTPAGGGSYSRLDGASSRLQLGVGKIGQIAASRTPLIVRGLRGDEEWLQNPSWIARQGVRTFVGLPLVANSSLVGVVALFDRVLLSDAALDEFRFLADFAAVRLLDIQRRHEIADDGTDKNALTSPIARAREETRDATRSTPGSTPTTIVTRAELRAFEKRSIEAALARCRGKVFGADGAAQLLGMKPTTLASRIKALGIR